MELVYLWVENYNNIQKQGFKCKFHDKYNNDGNLKNNCQSPTPITKAQK